AALFPILFRLHYGGDHPPVGCFSGQSCLLTPGTHLYNLTTISRPLEAGTTMYALILYAVSAVRVLLVWLATKSKNSFSTLFSRCPHFCCNCSSIASGEILVPAPMMRRVSCPMHSP